MLCHLYHNLKALTPKSKNDKIDAKMESSNGIIEPSIIFGFMRVSILGQSKGDSSTDALKSLQRAVEATEIHMDNGLGMYRNVLKMADRTL